MAAKRSVHIWLALLGPVVFMLMLEGAGRLWLGSRGEQFSSQFWLLDPVVGARMRPGFDGLDDHGLPVVINSLGLRNPELEDEAQRPRVFALGDSVTYGFGVEESEAWPRVLETELRERGRDVEVVNAGVSGYSTFQGLAFLERDLLALEPDVVLFAFMNNDRWDSKGKVHTVEGMRAEFERRGRRAWFFYNTALGRLSLRFMAGGLEGALKTPDTLREGARRVMERQQQAVQLPPPLELVPVEPDDPRLAGLDGFRDLLPTVSLPQRKQLLERLVALSREHGFRLVLLDFYDHGYMCEPLRVALEFAEAGDPVAAIERVKEYFASAAVRGTSGARLMDFDLYANRLLVDLYEAADVPPAERAFYFTRRPYKHLLLHLDVEVNGVSQGVAAEHGIESLGFRDLAFEDYLDHVHLTPHGNRVVAERIADLLMAR